MLVIGGGPAGLRAAEVAAEAGARVILADRMRSFGRKFLVAGKSGLNLTHAEEQKRFISRYPNCSQWLEDHFHRFTNEDVREWAREMGVETFVASSGRVYPSTMKGAPLLRRWVEKLRRLGVEFLLQHEVSGLCPGGAIFQGGKKVEAEALVLALGGASWARTGSDGSWVSLFPEEMVAPFQAANCGWEVDWPEDLRSQIEGQPVKNVILSAAGVEARGELMLTRYGVEGGPVYALGSVLREMKSPVLQLDLKPDQEVEVLAEKMRGVKRNWLRETGYRWKLSQPTRALVRALTPKFGGVEDLAWAVKNLKLPLKGPRPIDEAISSAGGVRQRFLEDDLAVRGFPGLYVAGEMIDWEAPTGGYLLQGCLLTGTVAGEAAAAFSD